MVNAEDVINLYKCFSTNGIQVWLTGGWGIDALLGHQTRLHKDLDVIMVLDDVSRMCEILTHDNYSLKDLWSENRWAVDGQEGRIATAFVLHDLEEHELDVHAMRFDEDGNGIPAWEEAEGFIFNRQDLTGMGMIVGFTVQCITAEKQMLCHSGYALPDKQFQDLELLHEKFGVEYPGEYYRPR